MVGEQNVGKSSLLEAIAHDKVKLPRGSTGKPVTRSAIRLQLRSCDRKEEEDVYFQARLCHARGGGNIAGTLCGDRSRIPMPGAG